VAGPAVPFVEELRIAAVQLPHPEGQIALRGLDEKVIMVGHEAVGVANPVVAFIDALEGVHELLLIAARGYVVNSSGYSMRRGWDMNEEYQKK